MPHASRRGNNPRKGGLNVFQAAQDGMKKKAMQERKEGLHRQFNEDGTVEVVHADPNWKPMDARSVDEPVGGGIVEESNLAEHTEGSESGEAAETSGGDSHAESGEETAGKIMDEVKSHKTKGKRK